VGAAIDFSWDYCAFPIWWGDDDDESALPQELGQALRSWSDEGTDHYTEALPDTPVAADWLAGWADRGRELARETARHLGPVDYHNPLSHAKERIEPPGRATSHAP
jgi:hypothetical protein